MNKTETGCPVTSKYGRTPPNKHGGMGREQQQVHPVDPFHSLDNLKNHFVSIAFGRNSAVYNVQNGAVIELSSYRPVSNRSFLSKVIEKVISTRILGHILDNNIVDSFQSAYRAGHGCETALLRVYNDIVTTVGKGNGSFLVLLDLFAAFDTIDHDNLFYILEKYVGIGGSALRLLDDQK